MLFRPQADPLQFVLNFPQIFIIIEIFVLKHLHRTPAFGIHPAVLAGHCGLALQFAVQKEIEPAVDVNKQLALIEMIVKPGLKIPAVIEIQFAVFHQRHISRQRAVFLLADSVMVNLQNRNEHKCNHKSHKYNVNPRVMFHDFKLSQIINQFITGHAAQSQHNDKHFPVKIRRLSDQIKIFSP